MWGSTQTIMMHFLLLPHCTMISKLWNNYSTMLRQHDSLFLAVQIFSLCSWSLFWMSCEPPQLWSVWGWVGIMCVRGLMRKQQRKRRLSGSSFVFSRLEERHLFEENLCGISSALNTLKCN